MKNFYKGRIGEFTVLQYLQVIKTPKRRADVNHITRMSQVNTRLNIIMVDVISKEDLMKPLQHGGQLWR